MSLFRRSEKRLAPPPATYDWFTNGGLAGLTPEQNLSARGAMSLAYVYGAIRHIVDNGTTLPLEFVREDGALRTPISPPPLFRDKLANNELLPWLSAAMQSLLIHGNAVGLKIGIDAYGNPADVLWLPRHWYSVDDAVLGAPKWYVNGKPTNPQDLVHVTWIKNPRWTLASSPLELFATTFNAGLNAGNYGSRWFRNGGFPPAVFKNTRQVLPPGAAEDVAAKLQQSISNGQPLVTGADWEFSAISIPPNQAAFIESQKLTADQVATIYGIDPTEIGGSAPHSLHYTTDESRQIKQAKNIQPYLVRLEHAFSSILPAKQFARFNIDAHIRADISVRYTAYQQGLAMGILNRNEIRAMEDMLPIPGGDKYVDPAVTPPPQRPPVAADQAAQDSGARRLSLIQEEQA